MDANTLARCCGATPALAAKYLGALTDAMLACGIHTPVRQAAFLAQIGHESQGLLYAREIWGPTPAQQRYEGRVDLGNVQPGDGRRYLGRGFVQVTGRANYRRAGVALGLPLETRPELLELPQHAARSAGWFWESHGLNALADAGDFVRITKIINGGTNGLAERQALWARAKEALNV